LWLPKLVNSDGDPAPNVVKTLRVEYQVGEQTLTTRATDPSASAS